jgi:DNA polymerase I
MARQSILPGMESDPAPAGSVPAASVPARGKRRQGAPLADKPAESNPPADKPSQSTPPETDAAAEPPQPADAAERSPTAPSSLEGQSVWVVDANSLIFQVFHAIPEMTSPRGEPVAAVFGFTRDVLYLIEQKKADYLFVAFDRSEPTFRHEFYENYKVTRSEMPVDLVPQFPAIRRMLAALGVATLDCATFEADDILATIAHQTEQLGGDCYLVTADKDVRQLISPRVKVYNVRKDQLYDACALLEDWGVRPEQVVDFQALVGDSVDNIPGVPLVGPKIAREWLEKFGSLDRLLEHAAELPAGKRRQNLIDFRQQALLSRRLVELDRHTPVEVDWTAGRVGGVDAPAVAALCAEFGFHSLAIRLAGLESKPPPPAAANIAVDYQAVDTPEKFSRFLAELERQPAFSFDTETTSVSPRWAELVGLSFSWAAGTGYYLPVRAPQGEPRLDAQATLEALRPILANPEVGKVGQNLKYDMIVLRSAGIELAGLEFDTMVASYLLDAGERNHNLDELAKRYLDHTTTKIAELIGSGKNQKRMDEVSVAQVTHYAAEDADVAWRLRPLLAARLAEANLLELFSQVEIPLIETLVEMEFNGICIDVPRLRVLSDRYTELLAQVEQEIYGLAGRQFNIGSPKQLQQILFEDHKLPILKRTKTGGSTDVEVLEELARQHPLPAKIIEYRQYSKLKSTYIDALPELVHPQTGRVHASFNQVVAATGRLSSSDPNLQNIPVRNESGREIRAAFLAGHEGWQLLAADYSQIELRVLAHYSHDETLCAALGRDEDIHALVASQVYGVPLEQVTGEMRRGAKAVNFGVIYGQSPFGLAKQLNIEQAEAARFINAYFDRYRGVEEFLFGILEDCQRSGYVNTILGRRRAISGIRSASGRQRNLPERTAINTVIQGSAADLIKLSMINILRRLRRERLAARLLLQIHDELVFEVPSAEIDTLAPLVVEEMSAAFALAVPLKVDVKVGSSWADAQRWNPQLGSTPFGAPA